jgi:ABC-type transporter Mla MlaB component
MLSSVARVDVQCFSTLSHKQQDFRGRGGAGRGGVTEYEICVLIFLYNIRLKFFSF